LLQSYFTRLPDKKLIVRFPRGQGTVSPANGDPFPAPAKGNFKVLRSCGDDPLVPCFGGTGFTKLPSPREMPRDRLLGELPRNEDKIENANLVRSKGDRGFCTQKRALPTNEAH